MIYLNKSFAMFALIINWISWTLNITFIMIVFFSKEYHSNLRQTEETLIKSNPLYFLDKEIETPETLRNLSSNNFRLILLCTYSVSFLFLFILSFSFCVPNSECSKECPCDKDNENQNQNSNDDTRTCLFFIYFQTHNNNAGNGNANAAAAAQGGVYFLIIIIVLCVFYCIFYIIYGITYSCGKYVSKFISIFILMLTNILICFSSIYLGFNEIYIIIASFSGIAVVCNFFGIVLPCCCLKLSYLYDNPNLKRLTKLRVRHSQKEEPFMEKVNPVPQEVLRDTITESAAPSVNKQKKEYDDNNEEKNDINLIEPGNQKQNVIDINQNQENYNRIDDNESDFNLIESGSKDSTIININQNQEYDNNIYNIDNGNDYNLIEPVNQEQDNINIDNAQINIP